MTNAELMTKSERCGALSLERRDLPNMRYAKVERSPRRLLNALQKITALPPNICALASRHTSSSEKTIHLGCFHEA
jgi:hypothetical protein